MSSLDGSVSIHAACVSNSVRVNGSKVEYQVEAGMTVELQAPVVGWFSLNRRARLKLGSRRLRISREVSVVDRLRKGKVSASNPLIGGLY